MTCQLHSIDAIGWSADMVINSFKPLFIHRIRRMSTQFGNGDSHPNRNEMNAAGLSDIVFKIPIGLCITVQLSRTLFLNGR